MAERAKILIVDDDKTWQAFLTVALQDDYEVMAVSNGDLGVITTREWMPDTVLLDIEMPVKNGYQVCAELKANPKTHDIPIIFLSSRSSLQEKISGFESGADDYLIKPCEQEILTAKVARSTTLYREKKLLDSKASDAQILAFEAMNSSADLGRSLRFAERTYTMTSFVKLSEGLFQTMAEFGLDTAVMFMTESGPQFFAQNGYDLSPLEKDMFLAVHREGRFCDFGNRTFCNFKLASLLIKNMPLSNPERYGRIKDSVPWIMGVVDGKVGALDMYHTLTNQHQYLSGAIRMLHDKLDELALGFGATNQAMLESTHSLYEHIESIPLSPEKVGSVTKDYEKIQQSLTTYDRLATGLGTLLSLLSEVQREQHQITNMVDSLSAKDLSIELGVNEVFSSDVDLF